jgi:tRNA dimethylallyltransferase
LRIGWDPGVAEVDESIAQRVQAMWQQGLVEEVRTLAPRMGRTARGAVGDREVLQALAAGQDPDTARETTVTATRRLARRQRRWFRRDAEVRWARTLSQVDQILGRLDV